MNPSPPDRVPRSVRRALSLLLCLAAAAIALTLWLDNGPRTGVDAALSLDGQRASNPASEDRSDSLDAQAQPARETDSTSVVPKRESDTPDRLPPVPSGHIRLIDSSGDPVPRRTLEFRLIPDERTPEALAARLDSHPSNHVFRRTSDHRGLVSHSGFPRQSYELTSTDDDFCLIAWMPRSRRSPPQWLRANLSATTSIVLDLDARAPGRFTRELVSAPITAASFRIFGDRKLAIRPRTTDIQRWAPWRVSQKLRAVRQQFEARWPDALLWIWLPTRPVPESVEFDVLTARVGLATYSIPTCMASKPRAPFDLRLEPTVDQRSSTLTISSARELSLYVQRRRGDLPFISIATNRPNELAPGQYFVHCHEKSEKRSLRKTFPAWIELTAGQDVRYAIRH